MNVEPGPAPAAPAAIAAVEPEIRAAADHRPDIDGLRAVAILCVVAFHAFPNVSPGGFVGVDVFFVISGFLISSIILRKLQRAEFSFADFYARRVRRLFPALCVVLIAVLVAGWYAFLSDEFKSLGKAALAGMTFVSNIVLWQESGYFDAAADSKPLLHLWSLGIEEQFYIVWPLVLYVAWKRGINAFRFSVVLAIISFATNVWLVHRDPVSAFYLILPRFWEILAGSLLAQSGARSTPANPRGTAPLGDGQWRRLDGAMGRNLQSAVGVALVMIAVVVLDKRAAFPGFWALLPVCGTLLMISAVPRAWLNRGVLSNRAMVWIGLVSYPLYLWHWPILVLLRLTSAEVPSASARLAAVAASVVLAWLTYILVDKPLRYGRYGARKVFALCTIAAAIGVAGATAYALNGVPSRFSESLGKLANFKYDYRIDYREGSCFLREEQDASSFGNCTNSSPAGAKSIVLWGDSHAAHLYPGLKASLEGTFKLTQLTASGCPPIVGIEIEGRPHCKAVNDYVLHRIITERPERVLLVASWAGGWDSRRIVDTIRALREGGIQGITLVGPVPHWKDGLPRALYLFSQQDALLHRVPQRTRFGLITTEPIDTAMRELAKAEHVAYLSPWNVLCDANGCLTRTDSGSGNPIQFDVVHLTAEGSRFLVAHLPAAPLEP